MIITEFYKGQGLGNQLWCYVTTRVLAKDKGFDFGIKSPELFKGFDFMDLDFGKQVFDGSGPEGGPPTTLPQGINHYYAEWRVIHPSGSDVRTRDPHLFEIENGTKIDGLLQDGDYISHRKDEVREWLRVKDEYDCREYSQDNICIINFRGGTYAYDKDFFLPAEYWKSAIANMRSRFGELKFIVITDDVETAKGFFPDFDVFHFNIAKDYSIIKNAKYLILSNSSFGWFPAWLSEDLKFCIAPKYWARHNVSDGYWSLGYNITEGWHYQDREGNIQDYETCLKEWDEYKKKNKDTFIINPPTQTTQSPLNPLSARVSNTILFFNTIRKNTSTIHALKEATLFAIKKTWNNVRGLIKKIFIGKPIDPNLSTVPPLRLVVLRNIRNVMTRFAKKIWNFSGIPALSDRIKENKVKKKWLPVKEIREYRKNIKIYDIFTFFNELDLLEIRLNILDPYVDYFILLEATRTYSGDPKPLYYQENKERYKKWNHKIIHYVVNDVPADEDELRGRLHADPRPNDLDKQIIVDSLTSDNIDRSVLHWFKEFYIKESLKKALVNLNDNDICYVSDLDEIWNPELIIDYSKDDVFKPTQVTYEYFLNNRSDEHWTGWTGTLVTKYKNIKDVCLNHLRTHRKMMNRYSYLRNGGWHFTFQGGYEGAKRKIVESNHFWYNPKEVLPNLQVRILKNQDHKGRSITLRKDETGLPKYLLANKEKYKEFFK